MNKASFVVAASVGAGWLAFAAPPSFGGVGGFIFDGSAIFTRTASSFDSTPEADLTGVSVPATQDHLYELGWAFRVQGDGHETFYGVPDSETYDADISDIHWNDVGGRGLFLANEHSHLFAFGGGALLAQDMEITNLTDNNLNVHIFHMADIDVQPSFSDDIATLDEWTPNRDIDIEDAGSNFAAYLSIPSGEDAAAAGFLVRAHGAGDVTTLLADAGITNFDNSGLPFGPGDVTAGYDFPLLVPPHGNGYAHVLVLINISQHCNSYTGIFCDGLEFGNRSVWSSSVPPGDPVFASRPIPRE